MKGEEEDLKFNLLNIEYVYRVRVMVFSAINLGSIYVFGLYSCYQWDQEKNVLIRQVTS
jgi:hypothetical protein